MSWWSENWARMGIPQRRATQVISSGEQLRFDHVDETKGVDSTGKATIPANFQ